MSSTSGIRRMARLVTVAAVLVVAGCTPIYQNHGYVPTEEELSRIEVGKSSREEVSAVIGRPSSVGVLQLPALQSQANQHRLKHLTLRNSGSRASNQPQQSARFVLLLSEKEN